MVVVAMGRIQRKAQIREGVVRLVMKRFSGRPLSSGCHEELMVSSVTRG